MHLTPLKPSIIPILCHGQEAVVRVPAGMALESPIELGLKKSDNNLPISLKIHAGKWSSATVIIRLTGGSDEKKVELRLSVIAQENSELKVVEFQNLSLKTYYVARRKVEVKKNAAMEFITFQIGSSSSDGVCDLSAKGAAVDVRCLQVAKGNQKHCSILNNYFVQSVNTANIISKSIAMDEGVIETQGKIIIPKGINATAADLKLHSLLLSRKAHVVATPALEIASDDVNVSHSASVSNLDDEQLFYFASRGVDPAEARRMMVKGFVGDIMERIEELKELKEKIIKLI